MTQIRRTWNNERGFSLIELLIVLLLLGLVLSMGYGIFGFSVTTFARGETKANTQQNMRLAMLHIEKEVRFAYDVEILASSDSIPTTVDAIAENDSYIFINDTGKLAIRTKENDWSLSDTFMDDTDFLLTFTREGNNLLGIRVGNTKDTHEIFTRLTIMNISEDDGSIIGESTGPALRITKL